MNHVKTNIALVGAGGTGSWLYPALCMDTHTLQKQGITKILVIDRDFVEPGNLSRQNHDPSSVGKSKAKTLTSAWEHVLPEKIETLPVCEWIQEDSNFPDHCVVIAAVDNHVARNNILEAVDRNPTCSAMLLGNEIESSSAIWYEPSWKGTSLDPRIRYPEITTDKSDDPRNPHCDSVSTGGQSASANLLAAALGLRLLRTWLMKVPKLSEATLQDKAPVELRATPFSIKHITYGEINHENFTD